MLTRIYVDDSFLGIDRFAAPIQLVEAQLSNLDHAKKLDQYGNVYSKFELADRLDEADLEVIPFDLKTCLQLGLFNQIYERLDMAEQAGKYVVLFAVNDDCLAKHRRRSNLITFANFGYRSKRGTNEFCVPYFFEDPLQVYRNGELSVRQKSEKATIGFCGRAVITPSRLSWQLLRNALRTFRSWTGIDPYAPPNIASEVAFRSRILNSLEKSQLVDTNFILRTKFLAGISRTPIVRDDPHHPVRLDFIENILDTDYTVCLRGAANWSMRLYESLSLGRIPVFVDTDSILPFDFHVEWKDHVVWVEAKDIYRIDEIVADFHSSLSDDDFVELQRAGRKLWETNLSMDGFFDHFREHLELIENNKDLSEPKVAENSAT